MTIKRPSHDKTMAPSRGLPLILCLSPTLSKSCRRSKYGTEALMCSKGFHSSQPQSNFLDTATSTVHAGIDILHSTVGLPWFIVLPITAITVRSLVALPLQIIARRDAVQFARLVAPEVVKERPALEKEIMEKFGDRGPTACTRILSIELRKKGFALRKRYGLGNGWKAWAPFGQLPVWLLVIETVRRMCGANVGLAGMVFGSGGGVATLEEEKGPTTMSSQDMIEGANLVSSEDDEELLSAISEATKETLSATSLSNPFFEPSLANEGMLWFPNLLAPDSTFTLSLGLGGILFAQALYADYQHAASEVTRSRLSTVLSGVTKGVALLIVPVTVSLPSGMLLYWFTSATTAIFQKRMVEIMMPVDTNELVVAQKEYQAAQAKRTGTTKKKYSPIKSRRNR